MSPEEELEYGLALLLAGAAEVGAAMDEIVHEGRDPAAWCVVLAPSAPGSHQFAVTTALRAQVAEEFIRQKGRHDIARGITAWTCRPGTCLVVVTCPVCTQLHTIHLPGGAA